MKKRIIVFSLVLVLLIPLLVPTMALARNNHTSFQAEGVITDITPGTVFPLGKSGWWRVTEREVSGVLSGDLSGDFTLTYQGKFKLDTQAGTFIGTMESGDSMLKVSGATEPLELVPTPFGTLLPKLTIQGKWHSVEKAQGTGDFQAWVIFIPTEDGHVGSIIDSAFTMSGNTFQAGWGHGEDND